MKFMRGLIQMVWHENENYFRPVVKSETFLLAVFCEVIWNKL